MATRIFKGMRDLTALLLAVLVPMLAADAGGAVPRPPCEGEPYPPPAPVGAPPNVAVWEGPEVIGGWTPAACLGWPFPAADLVVALAGSIRFGGGANELLPRFAAVSSLRDVRYWSVTEQGWRRLVTRAFALSGPDGARRADFTAAEMQSGVNLYFVQNDNRSTGDAVYRMRLGPVASERLVISIENVSALRYHVLPLFGPGELQSTYFLQRRSADVWDYYSISGIASGATRLPGMRASSYVNRAVAVFRHVAGIPTDEDPPLAR